MKRTENSEQVAITDYNKSSYTTDRNLLVGSPCYLYVEAKKGVAKFPLRTIDEDLLNLLLELGEDPNYSILCNLRAEGPNHSILIIPKDKNYGRVIDLINDKAYR